MFCLPNNWDCSEVGSKQMIEHHVMCSLGAVVALKSVISFACVCKDELWNCSLFFFFFFLGPHLRHMEFPRLTAESGYSCWPTPQTQQYGIRATSATYTIAHCNARSLTHWAGPGIKPASSWMLVRFVTTEPPWELPELLLKNVIQREDGGKNLSA